MICCLVDSLCEKCTLSISVCVLRTSKKINALLVVVQTSVVGANDDSQEVNMFSALHASRFTGANKDYKAVRAFNEPSAVVNSGGWVLGFVVL